MNLSEYTLRRVQAVQVSAEHLQAAADWIAGAAGEGGWFEYGAQDVQFKYKSGVLNVRAGDWLIRLGTGIYAITNDDFRQSFEECKPA